MPNVLSKRASYWAVIWGDLKDDEHREGIASSGPSDKSETLRLATIKTTSAYAACVQTFGLVAGNMWVKNLGTSIAPLRVGWRKAELLDRNKGEWIRISDKRFPRKEDPGQHVRFVYGKVVI